MEPCCNQIKICTKHAKEMKKNGITLEMINELASTGSNVFWYLPKSSKSNGIKQ